MIVLLRIARIVVSVSLMAAAPQLVGAHGDHASVCGAHTGWHRAYLERHNKMISGEIPGKYIVGIPVMAGLADVILGYVSGLLWALLTDRTFLIEYIPNLDGHCNSRSIEYAYHPRFVDWSAEPLQIAPEVYDCLLPPYTQGCPPNNNFKITMPGPNNTATVGRVVQMFQVNGGYKDQFRTEDMTKFPSENNKYESEAFLFLSNRGVTYRIFDNPHHNSTVRALGLTPETAFPCLFDFLFRLKPEACTDGCLTVERELRALAKPEHNTVRIGVHVRAEYAADAPEHFYCLDSLLQFYQQTQGKRVKVLLVTASVALQNKAVEKYKDLLLLPNNKVDGVIGVHDRSDSRTDHETNTTKEVCDKRISEDKIGMLNSARDMHLLSLTDIHIISSRSGFGVTSALMKPKPAPPIIYRMTNDDSQRRDCAKEPMGDPLHLFADAWSGL